MSSQTRMLRNGTTIAILVLEDDDQLAALLKDVLESCSYQVTTVQNGVQGLRCIMAEEFDLVLCDMVMPTFPGDKFYIAVERIKPALCRRFLFMTGHSVKLEYDFFIRNIGGSMLWKPFEPRELLAAIRVVLSRARQLDVAEWSRTLPVERGPSRRTVG